MKTRLITMVLFATVLFSCNKSDNPLLVPVNSFTWAYKGSSYTADVHIANWYSMAPKPIIAAYNKTNVPFPNYKLAITVNSFNVGTYTLNGSSSSSNTFHYFDNDGYELVCTRGSLNITANSNNVITGNFSVSVIDPYKVTRSIIGSFKNTPIKL